MKAITGLIAKLIYSLVLVLGLMPKRWSDRLADALGALSYALDRRHRRIALENLERAFGLEKTPAELKRIAVAAFQNLVRIGFEVGWSLRLGPEEIMRHCHVEGINNLRKACAQGKGVLILTLHIGNWEFLPLGVIVNGLKASLIYRPLDFAALDRFFFQYRSRFGAQPIPKKKSMRKVLNALKRKECVGVLLDQDSGRAAGVFADFFGHPACTNKGMALLALKTQAPVLPAYLIRRGNGFEIVFGPQVPLIQNSAKGDDLQVNTAQFNRVLEEIIRRYPEQWLWMHKRWKTKPEPEVAR
jgi:KDO2-lipid IV(A) lauroyltransferase